MCPKNLIYRKFSNSLRQYDFSPRLFLLAILQNVSDFHRLLISSALLPPSPIYTNFSSITLCIFFPLCCSEFSLKTLQQDRQCTCNIHSGAFVQPLLQWKKQCVTHSDCVFVASDIQHAMGMRRIVICGLLVSTTFFHIIS